MRRLAGTLEGIVGAAEFIIGSVLVVLFALVWWYFARPGLLAVVWLAKKTRLIQRWLVSSGDWRCQANQARGDRPRRTGHRRQSYPARLTQHGRRHSGPQTRLARTGEPNLELTQRMVELAYRRK